MFLALCGASVTGSSYARVFDGYRAERSIRRAWLLAGVVGLAMILTGLLGP